MTTINPYLSFNGNCEEAFLFYKSVFGGEFPYVGRFKDMPQDPEHPLPDAYLDKIMHMSLPISPYTTLMGSDSIEGLNQATVFGDNINLMISADSVEEVDGYWSKLVEGGSVVMALQKTFWGDYFGILKDRFGIYWMLDCKL